MASKIFGHLMIWCPVTVCYGFAWVAGQGIEATIGLGLGALVCAGIWLVTRPGRTDE